MSKTKPTPQGLTNEKVKQFQDLVIQMNNEQLIMIGMKTIVHSAIDRKIYDKFDYAMKKVYR